MRCRLSRLALAGISVLVTLLVLELGLRLFRPINYLRPAPEIPASEQQTLLITRASTIPGAIYDLKPNTLKTFGGVTIRTNSYGMRCHEPSQAGASTVTRVAAVGDSVTFGWDVEEQDTWPAVLETTLNGAPWDPARQSRFEVLNFGVPGYNTVREAALLKYKVLGWKPRVVIIAYVLNDPEITPVSPLTRSFLRPRWWQHSHLLRLVAKAERAWEMRTLGKGNYYLYLHAEGHPRWASVVEGFGDIRAAASQANARVLVVIFPFFPAGKDDWIGYPYTRIHEQVTALATRNGFDVLDLLPVYSKYKPAQVTLPNSVVHPNATGYKVAAAAIAAKLTLMLACP